MKVRIFMGKTTIEGNLLSLNKENGDLVISKPTKKENRIYYIKNYDYFYYLDGEKNEK